MTNLKNELPVAVHLSSGGDARVRTGGEVISLNGVASGSFQVTNATRYRLIYSARSMSGMLFLVGYMGGPVTLANASSIQLDLADFIDDVPEGTTVYFTVIDPDDGSPMPGGEMDALYVSYYG